MNKERIMSLLGSESPFERLQAIRIVRDRNLFSLSDILVEMLRKEENELVSEAIVETLKKFDVPEVSRAVSTLFEEDRLYLRDLAVVILAHHKKAAIPVLKEKVKDRDKHIRKLALDTLILMNDPQTIDIISLALDDSDPNNLIAAIEALGNFEAHNHAPKVLSILKEATDSFLIVTCFESLMKIGDEEIFREVNKAFPDPEYFPDFLLVPYLKLAIRFPYRDYLQMLLRLVKKKGETFHNEIVDLIKSYITFNKELEPLKKRELCSEIWKLSQSKIPSICKYEAIKLLGQTDCKDYEEKLVALLDSDDFFEQIGAIEALTFMKSEKGIEAIKAMLSKSPSEELKEIAKEAIKKASE